jgi:hypothetical protein
MIRFVIGFLFLLGAVGKQDYAMQAGISPPPLMETILMAFIGLGFMYSGVKRIKEKYGED